MYLYGDCKQFREDQPVQVQVVVEIDTQVSGMIQVDKYLLVSLQSSTTYITIKSLTHYLLKF